MDRETFLLKRAALQQKMEEVRAGWAATASAESRGDGHGAVSKIMSALKYVSWVQGKPILKAVLTMAALKVLQHGNRERAKAFF